MDPELADDTTSLDKIALLSITTTSGETENVGGSGGTKCKSKKKRKSKRSKFVPTDDAMAKILDLLRVDLNAVGDGKVKRAKGRAKVDSNWMNKFYRRLKSAALGLEDYNRRHKDAEYYLVKPIAARASIKQHKYASHANFLAKRKNSPESPVELFFAEVVYFSNNVLVCCLLKPELYPPDIIPPLENAKFHRGKMIHPEDFECLTCHIEKLRYL